MEALEQTLLPNQSPRVRIPTDRKRSPMGMRKKKGRIRKRVCEKKKKSGKERHSVSHAEAGRRRTDEAACSVSTPTSRKGGGGAAESGSSSTLLGARICAERKKKGRGGEGSRRGKEKRAISHGKAGRDTVREDGHGSSLGDWLKRRRIDRATSVNHALPSPTDAMKVSRGLVGGGGGSMPSGAQVEGGRDQTAPFEGALV